MKALVGAALLVFLSSGLVQAQGVSGRVFASHDSDGFDEKIATVGYQSLSGFGLKVGAMGYQAPGWSANGTLLGGTYLYDGSERRVDANLGMARLAGRDFAVGGIDYLRPIGVGTSVGLSVERNYLNSILGIRDGLTYNQLAAVADYAFNSRFNVGLAGGSTLFSDDNRRPFLRTRWNYELDPARGLNAYLKTRSYQNSSPQRPEYFSPGRLNEVSVGLSTRVAVAERFVLSAKVDAGTQHADGGAENIWSYSIGIGALRNAPIIWGLSLEGSNTAQFSAAGAYRYTSLLGHVNVPF